MPTPAPSAGPPLSRWQSTWRYLAAGVLGVSLLVQTHQVVAAMPAWVIGGDLAVGTVCMVLMHYRRRWPVVVNVLLSSAGAVSVSSAGAGAVGFISLCTRRRWREILPVGVIGVVATQLYYRLLPMQNPDSWLLELTVGILVTGILIAIGMYIGARRDLVASLQDRAERAEREQELQVLRAQEHERNKIAREMHDVLAHRMSLVAMHAGALGFRTNLTDAEIRQAAEVIQSNSHRALSDLREVLGVLRRSERDDESAHAVPDRPQPTLAQLGELIDDERAAGANVVLHNGVGDLTQVPDSIGRHAYRIIQEGLTNARKHAAGTRVDVSIDAASGAGVTLEVRNPRRVAADHPTIPGAGFGLVGVAERVALVDGRFEHGVTPQGHFVVRAWLPWPA